MSTVTQPNGSITLNLPGSAPTGQATVITAASVTEKTINQSNNVLLSDTVVVINN